MEIKEMSLAGVQTFKLSGKPFYNRTDEN